MNQDVKVMTESPPAILSKTRTSGRVDERGEIKTESGIFLYTVHCHDKPGILEKATIQIWILKYLNVLYMCGSMDII